MCAYFLGLAKRQGSVTKREGKMGIGRELVVSAMENERNSALDSSVGGSSWDTLDSAKGRRAELE